MLHEARELATKLVGGDGTNKSIVHPIRWPGSWHRKGTPRLAKIVAFSDDNEIDLTEAVERLRDASGAATFAGFGFKTSGKARGRRSRSRSLGSLGHPERRSSTWNDWNRIGMAAWAATGGSEAGRKAFAEWSAKSSKNDPAATEARWQHYRTSPPTRIGFGTLVYLARQHSPGWTYESAKDYTAEFAVEPVDPVDLWAKFDPPTLPRGVLPEVIEEFAFDRGMTMGCDMSGIAVGALAVCAAAIPDDIKLQPKKHDTEWQESARLWVALVGAPSTMKTPMMTRGRQAAASHRQRNGARQSDAHGRVQRLPKEEQKTDGPAQAAPAHDAWTPRSRRRRKS